METPPPPARPAGVPARVLVDSIVECHRAGGLVAFGETLRRHYAEVIGRLHTAAADPAEMEAAVAAVGRAPDSPAAAAQLAAAVATVRLDDDLKALLEKLLQQLAGRPTAEELLREIRQLPGGVAAWNITVSGDNRGVIGPVHGPVTFNES